MHDRQKFEERIFATWAAHFCAAPGAAAAPGTTLLADAGYAGKGVLSLWSIGQHVFVQADPAYLPQLSQLLAGLPATTCLSAGHIRQDWGAASIHEQSEELVFYLFPPDLPAYHPAPPYILRQLTLADAGAMEALHTACTPEEAKEGYVEVTHEIAFGCFSGSTLAAASSGFTRTGFMDIGVLTHPAHRRHGLAQAVTGALAEWSARHGHMAQYRCSALNHASRRVAETLNFRLYSQSESVWLA